jgi:hypothetical protein
MFAYCKCSSISALVAYRLHRLLLTTAVRVSRIRCSSKHNSAAHWRWTNSLVSTCYCSALQLEPLEWLVAHGFALDEWTCQG